MSKVLVVLLCLFPLVFSHHVFAGSASTNPWTLSVYFENDLFGETDQNYTNGIRVSWVSPDTTSYFDDPEFAPWIRKINKTLRFFNHIETGMEHNLVITLGQLMYTPSHIEETALLPNERPYAAYLYTGFAYHARSDKYLDSVEINLGIIGSAALGKEAQDFIHDLRGFDKFRGWDNQLENELAVNVSYEHKQRLFRHRLVKRLGQDFIAHGGVSVGNVATYLNVGGEYRIGWDLPNDFGTSAVRPGGDNSAPGQGDLRRRTGNAVFYGLHAFVSSDVRWVARDIFLDGNTFRDSHEVDKENGLAEFSSGLSFLSYGWKVSFAWVVRTREFKQQAHHHEYGSLSLSYSL